MSAWVLPDHIADVLPAEARHIEALRRALLDTAQSHGFELVIPPLLEHLESLLTGTGEALNLQTFKLVDQLSGRMLGIRADTTSQVARIDAHLLNRTNVTRLCYCGPIVHTLPGRPHASREPLQLGAEIYGHAGIEAETEIIRLALDCLAVARVKSVQVDLSDVRIPKILLLASGLSAKENNEILVALAAKDQGHLDELTSSMAPVPRDALRALGRLYGDRSVLAEASDLFQKFPLIQTILADLGCLADSMPEVRVSFDLSDVSGYAYYSGTHFSIYAPEGIDSLARGGRYDEVGAVFGRNRPAVGFSLDLRDLASVAPPSVRSNAIRAPWLKDIALIECVSKLRRAGEIVICVLPGHEAEHADDSCDRVLANHAGIWSIQPL